MWLLPVLLAAIACGQVESGPGAVDWVKSLFKPDAYIVGGQEAEPYGFPFQAALFINKGGYRSSCGGALIEPQWVLTAAHCVQDKNSSVSRDIKVILGANDRFNPGPNHQSFAAEKVIVPDEWAELYSKYDDLRKDIALIKLNKPAILSDKVTTIRLPSDSQKNTSFENEQAILSGWGMTSKDSKPFSTGKLRFVDAIVMPNVRCWEAYGSKRVTDGTICASGEHGKASCQGDSGGPMTVRDWDGKPLLIGVGSYGPATCGNGFPSAYIRVSKFLDWIRDNMKE